MPKRFQSIIINSSNNKLNKKNHGKSNKVKNLVINVPFDSRKEIDSVHIAIPQNKTIKKSN